MVKRIGGGLHGGEAKIFVYFRGYFIEIFRLSVLPAPLSFVACG